MRYTLTIVSGLILLIGCGSVNANQLYGPAPEADADSLLVMAATYSAERAGDALLVWKKGSLVLERYQNGFDSNEPHFLASGTKTFSGAMALAAVDDGLFALDDPVAQYVTEWQDAPQKAQITIRQLLHLTGGLGTQTGQVPSFDEAVQASLAHPPGEGFRYGPTAFQVFGALLERVLDGEDPTDYLARRVLSPIGTDIADWNRVDGDAQLAGGAFLTAHDWLRFGRLLLNDGQWEGEWMVDSALMPELTASTTASMNASPGYCLTTWLNAAVDTSEGDDAVVPGSPKSMPPGDPASDAAGTGQLFESIHVPGLTDVREGTNGAAFVDLDRDGLLDVVTVRTPPFELDSEGDSVRDRLRFLSNEGEFVFVEEQIELMGSDATPDDFGQGWRGSQVPVLADFDGDGFLDLFVTRQCPCRGGQIRQGFTAHGNSLFISDGSATSFVDRSGQLGVLNKRAYNRQPSLGDVNRDGFLDIAVGADNPTNGFEGIPKSVLLVFQPEDGAFQGGTFEDVGGTEIIPDFGGFYDDPSKDKAGPNLALRDMDNDGDLDLLQSTHVLARGEYNARRLPLSPIRYRQGVFTWRNLLEETGEFRFEKSTENGLADEARLEWNADAQVYVPADGQQAPGLAYLATADVTNSGFYDVITVDGTDPTFTPKTEDVAGRFWENQGGYTFREATEDTGLETLNDTYEQWYTFFDNEIPLWLTRKYDLDRWKQNEPGLGPVRPIGLRPYHADVVFADFDNNAWIDFVLLDRRESQNIETRAVLYLNRGEAGFEPITTEISGIDSSGLAGEAVDLNNDGRVDLFISGDPDNSAIEGREDTLVRYEDKVYVNTGELGENNHWMRFRFSGVSHAELIGARVELFDTDTDGRIGTRGIYTNHAYKTSSPLQAHFGLGQRESVDVEVTLPSGDVVRYQGVSANQFLDLNLDQGTYSRVD
ncbi:MAG: serine hydrolase [Bacteroidetes bacterium]|jgi:CubicO group peptidase (beta-lactamase class C family)|nr:serine hydrolase [Bacteroidota bacterium]